MTPSLIYCCLLSSFSIHVLFLILWLRQEWVVGVGGGQRVCLQTHPFAEWLQCRLIMSPRGLFWVVKGRTGRSNENVSFDEEPKNPGHWGTGLEYRPKAETDSECGCIVAGEGFRLVNMSSISVAVPWSQNWVPVVTLGPAAPSKLPPATERPLGSLQPCGPLVLVSRYFLSCSLQIQKGRTRGRALLRSPE